ncbi:integrin alpha-L-like [Dendropsophus ebraccatus]|uniref:integrin alpha-L-like n=1 Tax=Dendropsophus ebraccatus TaxID=150705 RepID=UPI003831D019
MAGSWLLVLLSVLGDLELSLSYNVEVSGHRLSPTEVGSRFGYKVRQFTSSIGQRVLVGDPDSNTLQSCDVSSKKCDNITLPNKHSASRLGLTLEVEPISGRFLVCGFEEPHDCFKTLYTNGACYTGDSNLTASQMQSPGYQECQKVEVDLCFLFDDSHSVGELEFNVTQKFLLSAIENLKNSTVNFAVVQFASNISKLFDFRDYQRGEGEKRVRNMKHLGGGTNTFRAIRFTLDEIFTPEAGARKQAKKVLLLLTDGEATDRNKGVTEKADKEGVTRYVIGVGKNFKLEFLTQIASRPVENHTRVMQDYSYLEGFFSELQSKILAIEGVAQGSSFTREMSSAGFSAALSQDRQVLGDPGIYDWSGGILDISEEEQLINMSRKEEEKYGYLGYSIKLFHNPNGLFCVVGSPRFQYVGLVTVLKEVAGELTWEKTGSVLGKQVGSYFGAEIAVSDLNQDGVTDLVLISAPHHYEPKWSGEVSVCWFTEHTLNCTATLHGEAGHRHSQFGAAVASLGDLDGDNYTEVAVGAPYEMDGKGALYIYKGGPTGLLAAYIQRLQSPEGIMGFGLSVHGVLDMTEDGLIDVVVGSWGHVTLHRSQPLLSVRVSVTANQTYLVISSLEERGCHSALTLEACVLTQIETPTYTGPPASISISYGLVLDSHRPGSRMFFTNKQREMNGTVVLQEPGRQCVNYNLSLQGCDLADMSDMQVSLTASLEQVKAPWRLSRSSDLSATNLISFQMCEEGEKCEQNISIQLHHSPLVVQDGASFSMFLGLHNMHVKAHQTRLSVSLPAGLHFRKANVSESSHRISVVCGDVMEQILMCNVSHPYLRRRVRAVIQIVFSIVSNMSWADHVLLAINVTSESDGNVTSSRTEVPVLYPIHIITRSLEDSSKHITFTKEDNKATAAHRYQIQNLGRYTIPVNLSVSVSSYEALMEGVKWDFIISSSQKSCVNGPDLSHSSAIQTLSKKTETTMNKTWQCIVDQSADLFINITGLLKPTNTWKVEKLLSVRSAVLIQYNQLRYHSDNLYHTAQLLTIDVKILAKVLAMRLNGVVRSVLHPDQTGFMRHRY